MVGDDLARDIEEPTGERAFSLERDELSTDDEEHLLHDVFDIHVSPAIRSWKWMAGWRGSPKPTPPKAD